MTGVSITVLILVVSVAAFVWNRLPVVIVALGVALSLFGTGVISLDEAFSGFGSGTVVLIAALFVVAEAIDAAGITTWLGGLLIRFAGWSRVRLVLLMMGITALLTSFISVNGAVAALLPMVVVLAVRLGRRPAQLLMPTAFAAHAGSLLVLTGSPVNILILNAALDSAGRGIGSPGNKRATSVRGAGWCTTSPASHHRRPGGQSRGTGGAVNAEARLRALQYSLLRLAGLALLAIVPAGGMPGRMRGDLPGQLEPDDPDALDLDPADTTTQRRA